MYITIGYDLNVGMGTSVGRELVHKFTRAFLVCPNRTRNKLKLAAEADRKVVDSGK